MAKQTLILQVSPGISQASVQDLTRLRNDALAAENKAANHVAQAGLSTQKAEHAANIAIDIKEIITEKASEASASAAKALANKNAAALSAELAEADRIVIQKLKDVMNVTCPEVFGAAGDGIADDYLPLVDAINYARNNNVEMHFKQADYYITGELPIYAGTKWIGAGMPYDKTDDLQITNIESIGGGLARVTINDPLNIIDHRIMSGDPIKLVSCDNTGNNGLFGVNSVDPAAKTITYHNGAAVTEIPTNAYVTVSRKVGGTIIRFQNLGDGSSHASSRFMDETGLRNVVISDIGFIGPGINSTWGGGIRFRRTPDNRAITGFEFNNVLLAHVAMDGLRFEQLIHSRLAHLRIERCVGDGLLMNGMGTATSVHIDTPYIINCRRGIASYTSAYLTLTNPVIEGCPIGYYFQRAIGPTLNALASETIKFDDAGQANGVTGLFVDCYGLVINSPTIYYNTEELAWSKAGLVFIDPRRRVESPLGVINGGHIHWSVGQKVPIVGSRWDAILGLGRVYVDVSDDWGYLPPTETQGSEWVGRSYWDESIQIKIGNVQRSSEFNERYKIDSIMRHPFASSSAFEAPRAPGPNDDVTAGFEPFSTTSGLWNNTTQPGRLGRWVCIDNTAGAARWKVADAIYQLEFEGRVNQGLSKQCEPVGSEAYAIRAGRNYGCDVATDNVQRVISTQTNGLGHLVMDLDVLHCFPRRYTIDSNYDPYTLAGSRGYIIAKHELVELEAVKYIVVDCVVSDLNGHVHDDLAQSRVDEDGDPIWVKFSELGMTYQFAPPLIKEVAATGHLQFYIPVEQFFTTGDQVDVFNPRLSEMQGKWTVDSADLVTSDIINSNPAVRVTCSDRTLRKDIALSMDDAVYVAMKWSAPVSTQLTVNGLDSLFTYDPAGAIHQPDSRGGGVIMDAGITEQIIDVPGANNFHFSADVPGSFTRARVKSSTLNTIIIERDDSTQTETVHWTGRRKKSPGYEAILDRH